MLAREVDFLKKLKVPYAHYLEMCWFCWWCRQFSLKNRTLLLILTVIIRKYLSKNTIIYLKFPQNKFQSHMHTSQQGQENLFSRMSHQLWGPPSFLLGWYRRFFPRGSNGLDVKLMTHLHLAQKLGMSGARGGIVHNEENREMDISKGATSTAVAAPSDLVPE